MKSVLLKIKRALSTASRGLAKVSDGFIKALRVVLVLGVVGYAVGVAWLFLYADKVSLDDHTVLVMDLKGVLVEESPGGLRDKVISEVQGSASNTIRLRDVLMTLELAAADPKIDKVLLKLDDFQGGGLVLLREVASAIERFKASGKQVVAWSARYDQRQYYLAAHANQVLAHPMGFVLMEGFGGHRNYYKDALDKLGIQANLIRVGQYKSAGEPFVLNAPSPEAIKAEAHVLDALWVLFTEGIEKARKLPAGSVAKNIGLLPDALVNAKGNAAQLALDWKWVDGLKTFDAVRESLIKDVGKDEETGSFRQVGWTRYLNSEAKKVKGDHIAIVVAEGEISDGRAPAGKIGGLSTSELIRKAADDEEVKAIVLRVNSPGGAVLGSELIRHQLQLARDKGKPVVVSMGNLAASGGYWIAMAADRVIGDPGTITGSIGVFAMLPTGEGLMGKLGINTGGHQTTWLAGAYDPRKALDPRMRTLVQSGIEHIYSDFISKAASARKMEVAQLDAVAQGRIWTGAQAVQHRLIDRLGSLGDAIDEARSLVAKGEGQAKGNSEGAAQLPYKYIAPNVSALEKLAMQYLGQTSAEQGDAPLKGAAVLAGLAGADSYLFNTLAADLTWLQTVFERRQPFAAVAHCLCDVKP